MALCLGRQYGSHKREKESIAIFFPDRAIGFDGSVGGNGTDPDANGTVRAGKPAKLLRRGEEAEDLSHPASTGVEETPANVRRPADIKTRGTPQMNRLLAS